MSATPRPFSRNIADDVTDDLPIWGAKAIGEAINCPPRVVHHMLKKKQIAAEKVGSRWVSTRRKLRAGLGIV